MIDIKGIRDVISIVGTATTLGLKLISFVQESLNQGDSFEDIVKKKCSEIPGFVNMLYEIKVVPNVSDADFEALHKRFDEAKKSDGLGE